MDGLPVDSAMISISNSPNSENMGEGGNAETRLPTEVWDIILRIVRLGDNYTQDNTASCRLVCREWRDLIDEARLSSNPKEARGYAWNPFFETNGNDHTEAQAVFGRTAGNYVSKVEELETLLTSFVGKTLIIDLRKQEDYRRVCERMPVVVDSLADRVKILKLIVDPSITSALDCIPLIPLKFKKLESLTLHTYLNWDWPYTPECSSLPSDALKKLVELNTLGNTQKYTGRLHESCTKAAATRIKSLEFFFQSSLPSNLHELEALYPNVDTLKLSYWDKEIQGSVDIPISSTTWNIQRLSLKFDEDHRVSRRTIYQTLSELRPLNKKLQELHVHFSQKNARLNPTCSDEAEFSSLRTLAFKMTTLSLPFFITEYPDLVKAILGACHKVIYLKFVYTEGSLKEATKTRLRKEVEEVVASVWEYLPPSVKWISVIFRECVRDTNQRRYMTHIVWRYAKCV